MLDPRTIALIGATDREDSIGFAVLKNLLKSSDRSLYPVNPGKSDILGIPCFPSIRDVPSPVDLCVIVTPASTVPAIVDECGQAGVAGVIILSAGFSESGPKGRVLEDKVNETRKKYKLRVIGPNCLGVIIPRLKLNATFLSVDVKPGKIALISHALGEEILDWGGTIGIGFSMYASLGSMIDVGFGDLIDLLNDDYHTRSIMIYMEHVKEPRRFISAGRGFALSKPIIVLKAGKSKKGSRIITGRTGKPIGDDRVYDAVFKRIGMMRVNEVRDLFNLAEVLDSYLLPRSPKLTVITNDSGVGIIAADALEERHGELSDLSDELIGTLRSLLPCNWPGDNPVDIMADADTQRYIDAIHACLVSKEVDGILVIYTPRAASDAVDVASAVIALYRTTPKPIIAVCMGGKRAAKGRQDLLASRVPAYATPEEAIKTYLYMYGYRRNIELLYETPAGVIEGQSSSRDSIKAAIRERIQKNTAILEPGYATALLSHYGIPYRVQNTAGMALRLTSYRDPDFQSVIMLATHNNDPDHSSIGLPPLNRTLARRLIDDLPLPPDDRPDFEKDGIIEKLTDILVMFSNIVVDFPEIEAMDISLGTMPCDIWASDASIRLVKGLNGKSPYDHLVIAPYPSQYVRTIKLRDGSEALMRPMRPEDEAMGHDLLSALSEETLRTRFFGSPQIDRNFLIRFCNIDYDREIAIHALVERNGKTIIIGGFRLISEAEPDVAQFAILVRDDYQDKGLGRQLMEVMLDVAKDKKLKEVYGLVLTDNLKMLALCRAIGFTSRLEPQGITRVSITLS